MRLCMVTNEDGYESKIIWKYCVPWAEPSKNYAQLKYPQLDATEVPTAKPHTTEVPTAKAGVTEVPTEKTRATQVPTEKTRA
jgi:hypothetical protein